MAASCCPFVKLDVHSRLQLEELVKQRTQELEEALQVKSRFLASMSHEMRTPLAGTRCVPLLRRSTDALRLCAKKVSLVSVAERRRRDGQPDIARRDASYTGAARSWYVTNVGSHT